MTFPTDGTSLPPLTTPGWRLEREGVAVGFQMPTIIISGSVLPEDEVFSGWVESRQAAPGCRELEYECVHLCVCGSARDSAHICEHDRIYEGVQLCLHACGCSCAV